MAEQEVVRVTEQELGVPWEDVFESIDPTPLAAGTIAQVHRATLTGGDRVVLKAQRPTAREEIEQDLALLKLFADRVRERPALQKVIDIEAVFKDRLDVPIVHQDLSTSRVLAVIMQRFDGYAALDGGFA